MKKNIKKKYNKIDFIIKNPNGNTTYVSNNGIIYNIPYEKRQKKYEKALIKMFEKQESIEVVKFRRTDKKWKTK